MGLVYAEIDLINGGDMYLHRQGQIKENEVKQVRVDALVDSGAYMLAINETVKAQLGLPFIEKQISTLADESAIEVEVVGPIEIRFENRRTTVDAIVLPGDSEVLLGKFPIDRMDTLVDSKQQKLIVNLKHPHIVQTHLK